MVRGLIFAGSVTIAVLALLVSQWTPPSAPRLENIRQGRNNTVLFLSCNEHGLSNVHVATAYALLERHPEVEVHYASFPPMGRKLGRVSDRARQINPSARSIVYHELPEELSFMASVYKGGEGPVDILHPPGLGSVNPITKYMPWFVSVWSADDHLTLFEKITDAIDEVDPSLVVLEVFLRPAIDAVYNRSRLHAYISPLTPLEHFLLDQPYGSWLWKYPVMGSGIPFPIPWTRLLENIYINLRYYYSLFRMAPQTDKKKNLESKGLVHPISWFNFRNADVPWISQALPGASTPVDVLPQNVTLTGPIILSTETAEEQAPELTKWIARAPTVLISLGTIFIYTEAQATAMAQAIADTLVLRSDLQVLWKFMKATDADGTTYDDEFLEPLRPFIESGRLKMESWLDVQPVTLLETGHIILSVHHGGAGCYHEALATGVPQMVLPQWADHFSFAQLTQDIGVGVWGCSDASPFWAAACLRDAFVTVLDSDRSVQIQEKAKYFGEIAKSNPGQYVAAREIAKWAASGYAA